MERRKYLRRRSEELATDGIRTAEIRQFLIEEGLDDLDADTIVSEVMKNVRAENRSHGCLRLMTGVVMLVFGTLALTALAASVTGKVPVLLSGRASIAFLVVGTTMVLTGILAIWSGIVSTATGK